MFVVNLYYKKCLACKTSYFPRKTVLLVPCAFDAVKYFLLSIDHEVFRGEFNKVGNYQTDQMIRRRLKHITSQLACISPKIINVIIIMANINLYRLRNALQNYERYQSDTNNFDPVVS